MPIPIEDIAAGVIAPLLVSSFILAVWCRFHKRKAPLRPAVAVSLGVGFSAAFALLPWAPLLPQEHWQWLPYLSLVAMIVGAASVADGIGWLERFALNLVVAAVTAWFLVPEWKSIESIRHWHLLVVGAGVVFLCAAIDPLARNRPGPALPLTFFATNLAGSVVVLSSGSLKFAQLGGAVVFSLLGCMLVAFIWRRKVSFRGAVPVYVVLLGGLMYIGRIHSYSEVPLASYVLVAVAPLGLWVTAVGPLTRRPKVWRIVTRVTSVLLPLAIAVGLAAWAS